MSSGTIQIAIIVIVSYIIVPLFLKVCYRNERFVLYTLGKYQRIIGPGWIFVIPFIQTIRRVDIRVRTFEINSIETVTLDRVVVRFTAVVSFRVIDPALAVNKIRNFEQSTKDVSHGIIRNFIPTCDLDVLRGNMEKILEQVRAEINSQTEEWGVMIEKVDFQNFKYPEKAAEMRFNPGLE